MNNISRQVAYAIVTRQQQSSEVSKMLNIVRVFFTLLAIHHSKVFSIEGPFVTNTELGSSVFGATQRKSGLEYVNLDKQHAGKESNSGFSNGNRGSHAGKQDILKYEDGGSTDTGYDKGSQNLGRAESVDEAKNSFERRHNGHHKKGYHRTGFTNNYHKNESGQNSSFYDDSDDEGGQNSADDNGSYYGQKSEKSFRDGGHDALYTTMNGARQGIRDSSDTYTDRRHAHDGYDDNQHYDDRELYSRDGIGRHYNKNDNEHYYWRKQLYPTVDGNKVYGFLPNHRHFYDYVPPARYNYERDNPHAVTYDSDYRYFSGHSTYPWQETHYPEHKFRDDRYSRGL